MKIILLIGARPNFIKAFPVYQALKNDFNLTLIHTGQHFDEKMSKVFFDQLKFPYPDIHLTLDKRTKAGDFDNKLYIDNEEYLLNKDKVIQDLIYYDSDLGQMGEIRDKLKIEFEKINPDLVMVFGDVTSTLAAGLSAKMLNIDIAHVESGLRSGDIKMPEEVNRILTDHITKYYFVTEQSGVDNLKASGITENVYLVGNTMIDTQKKYLTQALDTKYHETLSVKEKEYILITLHRPSNVDNIEKLKEIFDDLLELSKKEKIVYPIHPRTKKNLEKLGYLEKISENIILTDPLGYLEFTCLIANCKYIITDSGGIQEETTTLNIPCFTLRENTERPSTLIENNGTNKMISKISEIELKECKSSMELWDGKSSDRIYNILKNKIKNILFTGYDMKFIDEIINLYSHEYNVKIELWDVHKSKNEEENKKNLDWADIIFCEWCCANALWYSQNKKLHQKLFIRFHRFEINLDYIYKINWTNVDKIIFIAPFIQNEVENKLKNNHNFNSNKSILIYNYCKSINTKVKVKYYKFNIGILGYIPKYKRLDLSFDLIEKLVKKDKNFKLHIKGHNYKKYDWIAKDKIESDYFENLDKRKKNLKDNIIFYEHDNKIKEFFNKIGYITSFGDIEGSHQAIPEGMSCGTIPLISGGYTNKYGADLMYPEKFNHKNIDYLVEKVYEYSSNSKILEYEQEYCIEFSDNNFNLNLIKEKYDQLFFNKSIEYYNSNKLLYNENKLFLVHCDLYDCNDGSQVWVEDIVRACLSYSEDNKVFLLCKMKPVQSIILKQFYNNDKVILLHPRNINTVLNFNLDIKRKFSTEDNYNIINSINKLYDIHRIVSLSYDIKLVKKITENSNIANKTIFHSWIQDHDTHKHMNKFLYVINHTRQWMDIHVKNGIDRNKMIFQPPLTHISDIDTSIKKNRDKIAIVYAGTIKKEYNCIPMFKNILEILNNNENIVFNLVIAKIPFPFLKEFTPLLEELKNNKNVIIYENLERKEAINIINTSHIGVSFRNREMDVYEGYHYKLIDYMICNLACITDNVELNREQYGDDYPYLIDINSNKFKEKLLLAINDRNLYNKTVEKQKERTQMFIFENHIPKLRDIYMGEVKVFYETTPQLNDYKILDNTLNGNFNPNPMILKSHKIKMPDWSNYSKIIESYISWDFKRHSLEWLGIMLNESINRNYFKIEYILNILLNWIHNNDINDNTLSKMAWNDHSASSRINVITLFYFKLLNTKYLTNNIKSILIKSLYTHGKFIENYIKSNDKSMSNHIFIACRALLFLSIYFNKFYEESNKWFEYSLHKINKYFDNTFVDGINIESSVSYQFYLLLDYTRLIYILYKNGFKSFVTTKNLSDLKKIFNVSKIFLRNYDNKKTIPMIGDSPIELDFWDSKYELDDINKMINYIFKNDEITYDLFLVENNKSLINKDCGYILKNYKDDKNYSQVIFRTKPTFKTFHTQNDVNSFNYFYNGLDWITDTGFFNYEGDLRNYFKSSLAHNTIVKNLTDEECLTTDIIETQNSIILKSTYKSFEHSREFIHSDARLEIVDTIENLSNSNDEFSQLFHLHPDVKVEEYLFNAINKNDCLVKLSYNNMNLYIHLESGYFKILNGSEEPKIGWYSSDFEKIQKTNTIIFSKKTENTIKFKTIIDTNNTNNINDIKNDKKKNLPIIKKIILNAYPRSGTCFFTRVLEDIDSIHNINEGISYRFNYETTVKNITEKYIDRITDQRNRLDSNIKEIKNSEILINRLKQCKTKIEYFKTYCNEFRKYKKDNIKYLFAKTMSVDRTLAKEFIENNNDVYYVLIKRNIVDNFISHKRLKIKEWNVTKKIDRFTFDKGEFLEYEKKYIDYFDNLENILVKNNCGYIILNYEDILHKNNEVEKINYIIQNLNNNFKFDIVYPDKGRMMMKNNYIPVSVFSYINNFKEIYFDKDIKKYFRFNKKLVKNILYKNDYLNITLTISDFNYKRSEKYQFLEQVYYPDSEKNPIMISYNRFKKKIIELNEKTDEETNFYLDIGNDYIRHCFTTYSGKHLLMGRYNSNEKFTMYIFDSKWKLLNKKNKFDYCWHGTWSIDCNKNIIMFGDYCYSSKKVKLYRSKDDGDTWNVINELKGSFKNTDGVWIERDIRHYHTCLYDHYHKCWYKSSGDTPNNSILWKSDNDGNSWYRICDTTSITKIKETRKQSVFRHTSMIIDSKYLYWGTDDTLGDKARFIKLSKNDFKTIHIGDQIGGNEVRNCININEEYMISIAETKLEKGSEIYLVNKKTLKSYFLISLYSTLNKEHPFTDSISSKFAVNNIFYTFLNCDPNIGPINNFSTPCLKWEIEIDKNIKNELFISKQIPNKM